jgi:UDP-N-acetylglucosamine enolpyruvyl transferase
MSSQTKISNPLLLWPSRAAPVAEGASTLTNTSLIQRGYENLIPKLHALGAEVVEAE